MNNRFHLSESKTYILVHADGPPCHGTPLEFGRCPKCGIYPDMQSTEFFPLDTEKQNVPVSREE